MRRNPSRQSSTNKTTKTRTADEVKIDTFLVKDFHESDMRDAACTPSTQRQTYLSIGSISYSYYIQGVQGCNLFKMDAI